MSEFNPNDTPPRFPKIHAPFERTERSGGYFVTDEENESLSWFRDGIAVEKLEGTNCAASIEKGKVVNAWTRMGDKNMNYVPPYSTNTNFQRVVRGVQNAAQRSMFDGQEGHHFGELVGPKIQGNPYELDEHLFVPFSYARRHLHYTSWGKYGQSLEDIRGWFEDGLFSLFYSKMHGVDLDESSVSNGTYVEGIMFTHPDAQTVIQSRGDVNPEHFAKLRRDMFEGSSQWPAFGGMH